MADINRKIDVSTDFLPFSRVQVAEKQRTEKEAAHRRSINKGNSFCPHTIIHRSILEQPEISTFRVPHLSLHPGHSIFSCRSVRYTQTSKCLFRRAGECRRRLSV